MVIAMGVNDLATEGANAFLGHDIEQVCPECHGSGMVRVNQLLKTHNQVVLQQWTNSNNDIAGLYCIYTNGT